jgi:hypothetical protein
MRHNVCYINLNKRMARKLNIPDLDDQGKPFDEAAYFRKAGLTKPERTSRDKWDIVRERFKSRVYRP